MTSSSPSRLLSLPIEIRLLIWEHALLLIRPKEAEGFIQKREDTVATKSCDYQFRGPWLNMALLPTCRLVHAETCQLLIASTKRLLDGTNGDCHPATEDTILDAQMRRFSKVTTMLDLTRISDDLWRYIGLIAVFPYMQKLCIMITGHSLPDVYKLWDDWAGKTDSLAQHSEALTRNFQSQLASRGIERVPEDLRLTLRIPPDRAFAWGHDAWKHAVKKLFDGAARVWISVGGKRDNITLVAQGIRIKHRRKD